MHWQHRLAGQFIVREVMEAIASLHAPDAV